MESISFLDTSSYSKVVIPKRCTVKISWPKQNNSTDSKVAIDSEIYISFNQICREDEPPDSNNLPFKVEHDSIITKDEYTPPKCSHELSVKFDHKLALYSEERSTEGTRSCVEIVMTKNGLCVKRFNNITLKYGANASLDYTNGLNNINLVEDGNMNVAFSDDNSSEDGNELVTPCTSNTTTTQANLPAGHYKFGPKLDIMFKYQISSGSYASFTCVKSPFSGTNPMRIYSGK